MPIGAWNKRRKVWVKWLGYTCSASSMRTRLRKYSAPSHVHERKIPDSTFWGKKNVCKR